MKNLFPLNLFPDRKIEDILIINLHNGWKPTQILFKNGEIEEVDSMFTESFSLFAKKLDFLIAKSSPSYEPNEIFFNCCLIEKLYTRNIYVGEEYATEVIVFWRKNDKAIRQREIYDLKTWNEILSRLPESERLRLTIMEDL